MMMGKTPTTVAATVAMAMMGMGSNVFAGPSWLGDQPALPTERSGAVGAVSDDGDVYIIGGKDITGKASDVVELYDIVFGEYDSAPSLPKAVYDAGAAAAGDGSFYVMGGLDVNGRNVTDVMRFDVKAKSWSMKAPLRTARHGHGVAAFDGSVIAVGGAVCSMNGVCHTSASVDKYDIATDSWTAAAFPALAVDRMNFGLNVVNGNVWVVGGCRTQSPSSDYRSDCVATDSVEMYNTATGMWESKAPLPSPRQGFQLSFFGGDLIVLGGSEANGIDTDASAAGVSSDVLWYSIEDDEWHVQEPEFAEPRTQVVRGDLRSGIVILVVGGVDAKNTLSNTTNAYVLRC